VWFYQDRSLFGEYLLAARIVPLQLPCWSFRLISQYCCLWYYYFQLNHLLSFLEAIISEKYCWDFKSTIFLWFAATWFSFHWPDCEHDLSRTFYWEWIFQPHSECHTVRLASRTPCVCWRCQTCGWIVWEYLGSLLLFGWTPTSTWTWPYHRT